MQQIVAPVRNIDAPIGCEDRIMWIHRTLGGESEVGRVLRHHVAQSIIVGGVAALAVSKGLGSALAHWHFAYQDIS